MSAPETPSNLSGAPGYMAAQQDPSPVPGQQEHAVIPAPASPALPVNQSAELPAVYTDLSLRRASLGTPFYAEADAGLRDGPLEESKGLLPDLVQIWEALEIGFEGIDPLQPAAVTMVMDRILRAVASEEWGHDEIGRLATSFQRIQFVVEELAADNPQRLPSRDPEADPRPPCSIHMILMHMLEHGFVIENITEAGNVEGYALTKVRRLEAMSKEERLLTVKKFGSSKKKAG
eukprot:COSAG02_NODE_16990_length_1037_cov_57.933902_1_plen_233_part_00